jgi:YHS domain-containing protein
VLPDEPATELYVVEHEGRQIYLCCDECMAMFRDSPEAYLDNLPPSIPSNKSDSTLFSGDPQDRPWWFGVWLKLEPWLGWAALPHLGPWQWIGLTFLLSLILMIGARVELNRSKSSPINLALAKPLSHVYFPSVTALGVGVVMLGMRYEEQADELKAATAQLDDQRLMDRLHSTSLNVFGDPPLPRRRSDLTESFGGTYFRGNDSRGSQMFNGGNHLTAKFHLALVDAAGETVELNDDIQSSKLLIQIDLERGPHTPVQYYTSEHMSRMFLTDSPDTGLRVDSRSPGRHRLDW